MKSLFILIALSVFSIVIKAENKKVVIPPDVKYSVINKEILLNLKRSLDIRINKRVSKNVLKTIALKLKAQDNKKYKRTFIGYYLPNMKINAGYWASTHFNPNLEIKIYGMSKKEFEKITKTKTVNKKEKIIGSWIDTESAFKGRITIYKKDNKLYMRKIYKDGSIANHECKKYKVGSQSRIKKKSDKLGDYFVIDKKGYLWHGDSEEGLWGKCKKITK